MISDCDVQKLALAIELTKNKEPLLLPLLEKARISFDERVESACVYPSGRILISPDFTANLGAYELSYIISHELLHLYYKSAEQGKEFGNQHLVNVSHDFIINGKLSCDYLMKPPNDGLDWSRYIFLVRDLNNAKGYACDSLFSILEDIGYYDEDDGEYVNYHVYCDVPDLVPFALRPAHWEVYCWKKVKSCSTEVFFALLKKLPEWLQEDSDLREKYSSDIPYPQFVPSSELGVGAFDGLNPGDFGDDNVKTNEESADNTQDAASSESKEDPERLENDKSADNDSAEELLSILKPKTNNGIDDEKARRKPAIHIWCLDNHQGHDVREADEELSLFPETSPEELKKQENIILETVKNVAEVKLLSDMLQQSNRHGMGGYGTGNLSWEVKVINDNYAVPWERALQRWMDANAPRTRNWTSASRRLGDRRDICLPGRTRNGWTAYFVLDTSGSMIWILPRMLGALATFCQNNNVEMVRLLQCDTEICFDEIVEVENLNTVQMYGGGDNDMSPAMERLAEDSEVQAVVVLTDGYGVLHPEYVPYDVLWVLPEPNYSFSPSYGTVIPMNLGCDDKHY